MEKYDLERFFNFSVDMCCIAGMDGFFKQINPAFEKTLGWTEKDLLSSPFTNFIHPEDVQATIKEVEKLGQGIPTISFLNRYLCANGQYKWLLWTARPDPDSDLLYAIAKDITESKLAEERFYLAIEASPNAMIMVNSGGKIFYVNKEAGRVFGYSPQDLVNQSIEVLVPESTRGSHPEYRSKYLGHPTPRPMGARKDLFAVRSDHSEFPVEIGLSPVRTTEGVFVLVAIIDLTEQKKAEERILATAKQLEDANQLLTKLANTDGLTGLKNRRAFEERLEYLTRVAYRTGISLSLLILDVDDFKSFNDTFGHLEGDNVLKSLADILQDNIRGSDFVARFGGEEFAVILPGTGPERAITTAERYREAIERFSWKKRDITASFGCATIPLEKPTHLDIKQWVMRLLNEADEALYLSKETGKNKVTHFGLS